MFYKMFYKTFSKSDTTRASSSLEILLAIGVSWVSISAMRTLEAAERDRIMEKWCIAKKEELVYVGTTAAILSSLLGSAFTWPAAANPTWPIAACWYGGLMFTIASIATATQQSIMLHRFSSHPDYLERMWHVLGYDFDESGYPGNKSRAPRYCQLFIWQIPFMMLRFGVYLFLLGLCILLWQAAYKQGHWSSPDCKVALICAIISVFALVCHVISVLFGYSRWYSSHKRMSRTDEEKATAPTNAEKATPPTNEEGATLPTDRGA